jgi:hypothetical protein
LKVDVCAYSILTALGLAIIPIILSPEWPALSFATKEEKINVSAIVLDTAVNVMVTAMISMRILSIYWMTNKGVNPVQAHVKRYINVVAMLVESAAPCTILGILVCVNQLISDQNGSLFVLCDGVIGETWAMSIVSCFL